MSAGDDEDSALLSLLSSASKTTETAAAESHEASASPPPDALKDGTRSRRSDSTPDNMTHKIKIYFPDRTYRNILCMPHITAAEVKRKLLSRMQLPSDHMVQLLHAALDGSNFRVIFDSEFLQSQSLSAEDAAGAADHGSKTYISSASAKSDVSMVYLAKTVPRAKEGEEDVAFTSAVYGRGYLSRRKPSSKRHRRYFFQLWRVKKMLAMFKMNDEVHSVVPLNGATVIAAEDNDLEFVVRVPGEGDYSFLAESQLERNDWLWVLGGVDSDHTSGRLTAALSRRASVSSAGGKRADRQHSSSISAMVDSRASKASAIFEGVLFKTGKGLVGKSFFQPRRVRITNGMLMYYKAGQDNSHPSGVIMLKHCNVSSFVRPNTSEPFGFILNSFGRDYHFASRDSSERDRWMTAILSVCSTQSALGQDEIQAVAFDLQPVLQQVVSVTTAVEACLDYFKGKPTIDVDSPPWFSDFSAHLNAVVDGIMSTIMAGTCPVRLFLNRRLGAASTPENCQRSASICLQQLIMPAILPELLVQLGYLRGQFELLTEHFSVRCRLVLEHPNFFDSLNLPSRDCNFDMGIKLMSRLPLLTDPHALLSSIVSVIDSAQSDLKMLLGARAPVLTGDHMFCFLLYFILKATPAPHHLFSEVVSLLNTPFNLEGSRGYIAATYCAAVTYILSFSSSLQREAGDDFVLAANTLRHVPSKRFTKRLASLRLKRCPSLDVPAVVREEPEQLRPLSTPAGSAAAASLEALLGAAELDASSSDEESAEPTLAA